MSNILEIRAYKHATGLEVRAVDGVSKLSGYGAVYNSYSQDLGGFIELVAPSAFERSLSLVEANSFDVWSGIQHKAERLLGTTESNSLHLRSDDKGLHYTVDLDMEDPDSRSIASKVSTGKIKGSSFGFYLQEEEWQISERGYPVRVLKDVILRDVSPVLDPAYKATEDQNLALSLRSLATQVDENIETLMKASTEKTLVNYVKDLLSERSKTESSGEEQNNSNDEVDNGEERTYKPLPAHLRRYLIG